MSSTISDSPALRVANECMVTFGELPFAYRLRKFFEKSDVSTVFEPTDYSIPAFENKLLVDYTQMNITKNDPESLGAEIVRRFGGKLIFTDLPLPMFVDRNTNSEWPFVEFASLSRAHGVHVRRVLIWFKDTMVQRWDVLVKKG